MRSNTTKAARKNFRKDPSAGLPRNEQAEHAVLVYLLRGGEWREDLACNHFALEREQTIFRIMEALHAAGEKIDVQRLSTELETKDQLKNIGGLRFLSDLLYGGWPADPVETYIGIIQRESARRDTVHIGNTLMNQALLSNGSTDELITLLEDTMARLRQVGPVVRREFVSAGDGSYSLTISGLGIALKIERLRPEWGALVGELSVTCGSRSLSVADFHLSSARDRVERAKILDDRAPHVFDWDQLIEEFSVQVLQLERAGQASVDLREVSRPTEDEMHRFEGLALPRRHSTIIFGDGGTAKSYFGLYFAGRMAEEGLSVAFFDFELDQETQRLRLERLFPDGMPRVRYVKCDRPLVYEVDRLCRIVRDDHIDYAVFEFHCLRLRRPARRSRDSGKILQGSEAYRRRIAAHRPCHQGRERRPEAFRKRLLA
jgi:hypothetical protein